MLIPPPQNNLQTQLLLSCWLDSIQLEGLPQEVLNQARLFMFFDKKIPTRIMDNPHNQNFIIEENDCFMLPIREPKFLDVLSLRFQKYADSIVDKLYIHSKDILGERGAFIFKIDSRVNEHNPAELRAHSYPYQIHISLQELANYENEDEMAFVLAHELVHKTLGEAICVESTKQEEAMADVLGLLIMMRAGYHAMGALMCISNWEPNMVNYLNQLLTQPLADIPNPHGVIGMGELHQLGLIKKTTRLPKNIMQILEHEKDPHPVDSTRAAYLYTFGNYLKKLNIGGHKLTPIESNLKSLIRARVHKKPSAYKKHVSRKVISKINRRNQAFAKQIGE